MNTGTPPRISGSLWTTVATLGTPTSCFHFTSRAAARLLGSLGAAAVPVRSCSAERRSSGRRDRSHQPLDRHDRRDHPVVRGDPFLRQALAPEPELLP